MNKPIIRKRGRPKKINKDNQNNIKPIEHELILYYPFKLCDFENNLDNHQVVDNIFNNNDQKIYVDDITKDLIESETDINLDSNIINVSTNKLLQPNNNIVLKCPFELKDSFIVVPEYTSICCMYDTCKMKCKPIFLPDRYLNGIFYVIGWFCSISCAMSYNLRLNDSNVNKRMNLLFYLYGIHNEDNIHPAPNILLLKKYGGKYSINEYRNITKFNYPITSQNPIVYDSTTLEFIDE